MSEFADAAFRRPRRLLGLLEEAWRRQRRRRVRVALLAIAIILAAAAASRVDRSPPPDRGVPGPSPVVTQLSSAAVPASGNFASLAHVAGRLIISGGPHGSPLDVSGATTTLARGRADGSCTAATVIPGTVRVGPVHRANCGDPALYGLHVLPVMFYEHRPRNQPLTIGVRIAVADHVARDGYRLRPIVMSYPECSDCEAQWIEGDGSLWINGSYASPRHHEGLLLRVSTRTGRVLQRVPVPGFASALLAVNQNGLWFAPSIETGSPPHPSRREQREYESLSLVAPGAARSRQILRLGTEGADWLTAAGDRIWLEDRPTPNSSHILTFTATNPADGRHSPRHRLGYAPGELGAGAIPLAATTRDGVDAIIATSNDQQHIININATTLAEHILATIPLTGSDIAQPAAATQGTSAYFLDPRLSYANVVTPARLYRISRP